MSDREPDPSTMTRLEACTQAMIACTMAYTYPSDLEVQAGAIAAFAQATGGGDYPHTVASVMEHMIPASCPADQAAAAARWYVVEYCVSEINALRAQGALPRMHVSQAGEPLPYSGIAYQDPDASPDWADPR